MKNQQNLKRILLIDDESSWLHFAENILREAGYTVRTERTLQEGIQLVQKESFDFILIDLKKIEQEKTVIQEIASLQKPNDQFMIAMFPTELSPEKVGEIFKLGVHDCVDKPYEESKLLALIESQIAKRPVANLIVHKLSEKERATILIVEDDEDWRNKLVNYLKTEPYQLETTGDYSEALLFLEQKNFDLIILDLRLIDDSENFEGMKLLELIREQGKKMAVIIISAYGTVEHVRDGFKIHNIFHYISKQNFDRNKYRQSVQQAIQQRAINEIQLLRQ